MVSVQMKVTGPLFEKGPAVVQKHIDRFVTNATNHLYRAVVVKTPRGAGGEAGLSGSIQPDVTGKGTSMVRGVVGTAQPYGEVIERGRRPGSMPPKGALIAWIQMKFGIQDPREAARIEYPVRRKIAQKGFDGAAMFHDGLWENWPTLQMMARREGIELVVELNNA